MGPFRDHRDSAGEARLKRPIGPERHQTAVLHIFTGLVESHRAQRVGSCARMPALKRSRRHAQPVVCSIGSVDPLAAAGLAADMHVYHALAVRPVLVVTAVTAQNSARVRSVQTIPARIIRQELESVWEQVQPDAICIGLVPHPEGLRALRKFLRSRRQHAAIVLDPVLRASSGQMLSLPGARAELLALLPLATIVTPNIDEAQRLSGRRIANLAQARAAALELSRLGCAVLITGGHLPGAQSVDVFAHKDEVRLFSHRRLALGMRGSGGILAAALAAHLARGLGLSDAIASARRFVAGALRHAQPLGSGMPQLAARSRAGDGVRKRSKVRIS